VARNEKFDAAPHLRCRPGIPQEWETNMVAGSFAQVETFGFEPLLDSSRHARSIDLFDLLFGEIDTFSRSAPGRYPAPVRLSAFTIALRKRSSPRASSSCTA
jgi:hypothetical protein